MIFQILLVFEEIVVNVWIFFFFFFKFQDELL